MLRLDEDLQPSYCLVLEEDEGFSDWSHRLENRNEQEVPEDCRTTAQRPSQWKLETEEKKQCEDEEEEGCGPERGFWSKEDSASPPEKVQCQINIVNTGAFRWSWHDNR